MSMRLMEPVESAANAQIWGSKKRKRFKRPLIGVDQNPAPGPGFYRFACPYLKVYPDKYGTHRGCSKGWDSIHRLKEHLRRTHVLKNSYRCIRCGMAFETTEDLSRHSKSDLPCYPSLVTATYEDGLDSAQLNELHKFRWSKNGDLEQYWGSLCKILFPALGDGDIPSPYCEDRDLITRYDDFAYESMLSSPSLRESLTLVLRTPLSAQDSITRILEEINRYKIENVRPAFNSVQPISVGMTRTPSNASMESTCSFCEDDDPGAFSFTQNNSLPPGGVEWHRLLDNPNFKQFEAPSGLPAGAGTQDAPGSLGNQLDPYANFDFGLELAPISANWMPLPTASGPPPDQLTAAGPDAGCL